VLKRDGALEVLLDLEVSEFNLAPEVEACLPSAGQHRGQSATVEVGPFEVGVCERDDLGETNEAIWERKA
jgi:hypothetical protein